MKNTEVVKVDCKTCRQHMADLLLDDAYVAGKPEFAAHLKECSACSAELAELQATFAVLDSWTAPEPTPYFDAKVHVMLREELAAAPEGFWARIRSTMMFSTGRALRPMLAGALALVMVAGGGGVLIGLHQAAPGPEAASPTVNDLRILDRNAQALQQMDQLLEEPASPDETTAQPTT